MAAKLTREDVDAVLKDQRRVLRQCLYATLEREKIAIHALRQLGATALADEMQAERADALEICVAEINPRPETTN